MFGFGCRLVSVAVPKQGLKYFALATSAMNDPIVTVTQGKLKGAIKKLLDGTSYYSFKGVPYAKTPTGKFRFMAPLPAEPWQGTYEAIKHGPICPQYDMTTKSLVESEENCLFLNVYTRSLHPDSKLPVMVFLHGGAYMSGSGNSNPLGPEFILQHDVILVTVNYRLEALGFLCLDTPEVPGNAGMKDQVAALKWVKNNISKFGGDSNNVTLFGESAGASCVTFHMQSPMSNGLFQKAIAQSGVSTHDWSQGKDGKERAIRAGKLLGKDTTDTSQLLEFLRSLPAIRLAGITTNTMSEDETLRGLPIHFAPVVEKKFDNVEPFLTIEPMDAVLSKNIRDIPLMIGYNSVEALTVIGPYLKKLDAINRNTKYLVPREVAKQLTDERMKDFGDKIRQFYVGDRTFNDKDVEKLSDMYSDNYFIYNVHRFSHFYSDICKSLYMYKFNCDTPLNIMKILQKKTNIKGATHVDDIFYLFCNPLNRQPYENEERLREIVFRITKLWTDFAKTGNPTPDNSLGVKWTPYNTTTRNYLDINEKLSVGQYADRDRVEFWNKMYSRSGLPCITNSNL